MALPTDETRATHAAAVPVYVRAAADGTYQVVDTATDEPVSVEHASAKGALETALKMAPIAAFMKDAVLREQGEPIGAWRWLDASAVEDEPIGGTRITEASIWEMCASLNGRESAIPINGGGAPRAGLAESLPHGDAYLGGDHPANGWAHVALPVVEKTGRTHLYLRSELFEKIAQEVDLGRLAFGSIRFGFETIDADDNDGISGATLISHALTNDQAVTTLTPGSKRKHEPAFIACRSRRMTMTQKTTQRGPAGDVLSKIATVLGMSTEDLEADNWKVYDAVCALANAKKVEDIVEGASSTETPPATDAAAAPRSAKREESYDPEKVMMMLAWARDVLGKPEATLEDAMAELEARKEEIGKLLGTDTPPAAEAPPSEEKADPPPDEEKKPTDPPPPPPAEDEEEKQRAALRERDAKIARLETEQWVRAELRSRHLDRQHGTRSPVSDKEVAELVDDALIGERGRALVIKLLDSRNAPPSSNPLDSAPLPETPASYAEAVAEGGSIWLEAEKIERAKDPKVAKHVIAGRANRIVERDFPALLRS